MSTGTAAGTDGAFGARAPAVYSRVMSLSSRDACVLGGSLLAVQVAKGFASLDINHSDFFMYYLSALQARTGRPMYVLETGELFRNHTPPHLEALVVPFTFLPPAAAYLAWSVLMLACAWLTLRIVVREVAVDRWTLAAWLLNASGVQLALRVGQCSWLVALPVTLAWREARDRRWIRSALWAGTAIALKPFLLVLLAAYLLRGQWRALAASVLMVAAWLAVGVMLFGLANTVGWLSVLSVPPKVSFFTHAVNASIMGFVARAGLPLIIGTVLSLSLLLVTAARAWRMETDRAWLLLLTAALLASPLGWISYLPLLVGPLVAVARVSSRGLLAFGVLMLLPAFGAEAFAGSALVNLTLGSAYGWGLIALWSSPANADARQAISPAAHLGGWQVGS